MNAECRMNSYFFGGRDATMRIESKAMTLTVSLPADAETKLQARADAAGQDMAQFVEQLLKKEIAASLSVSTAQDTTAALDLQYERGYAQLPEDLSLTTALLPHLAVDLERWD